MTDKEIKSKIAELKYRDDSVRITGVCPSMLENMFNFKDGGIHVIGGRDLDYEGETIDYSFSGSAYYGNCDVTKKHGPNRPKEVEPDRYLRTRFERGGVVIDNVPPAVECTEELLAAIKEDSEYRLWYIVFNSCGKSVLYGFYAKNECNVRYRALSIWGRYDAICAEEDILCVKEKYGEAIFVRTHDIKEKKYVLKDEDKV